jgi:hypothetical protein
MLQLSIRGEGRIPIVTDQLISEANFTHAYTLLEMPLVNSMPWFSPNGQ